MAFHERNGNMNLLHASLQERDRDALLAEFQQEAELSEPFSNNLNPSRFFNPVPANPEAFARYQRDQKLQFMLWQREQEQGFLTSRNAQSTNFVPDPVSGTAQVFGAFVCPQLSTKTAAAEVEEAPSRSFLESSLPLLSQEKHTHPTAAATESLPQFLGYTTTNSNNTGQSDQITDLETADLENDMILKQLEDALQLITTERKQAYLESLEACNENVPSFLFQFLRRCDYNVWDAAERLVRYWQFRKEIFAERAFLPMVLTGEGALTTDDVLQLKAGFPAMLPDTKTGEKVVFFDRAQWLPNATCAQKLRCTFYMAHVPALQSIKTQTEGVMAITLVSQPRWRRHDAEYTRVSLWMAENILPVRVTYHLLNFPAAPRRRFLLQDLLYEIIRCVARHGATQENVFVHFERHKGELLDALLDLGLKREGIPTVVGGTFLYSECVKWCHHQYYVDSQKYGSVATPSSGELPFSGMTDNASGGACAIKRPDYEEKKQRKREMNVIHSRRKRERRRAEIQDVVDERDELLGEQESLLAEHARLTSLLDQANQAIRASSFKVDTAYT